MNESQPRDATNGVEQAAGAPNTEPAANAEVYLIPTPLAQATLEYLGSRPYREVFALIRAFEQLRPAPAASSCYEQ